MAHTMVKETSTLGVIGVAMWMIGAPIFSVFALTVPVGEVLASSATKTTGLIGVLATLPIILIGLYLGGHPPGTGPRR